MIKRFREKSFKIIYDIVLAKQDIENVKIGKPIKFGLDKPARTFNRESEGKQY